MRRTLLAALLVALGLGALLGGGLWWGGGALRAAQTALLAGPRAEGDRVAHELAAQLGARLEQLRRSESARPYYEYQNLYHDPRAGSAGPSVAPSPLANGPSDPLVENYFQIDPKGNATLPVLNDDVPELSLRQDLEKNRRWRASVAEAGSALRSAANEAPPAELLLLDHDTYDQNQRTVEVYQQTRGNAPPPRPSASVEDPYEPEPAPPASASAAPSAAPPTAPTAAPPTPAADVPAHAPPPPRPRPRRTVARPPPPPPPPVPVAVTPLAWNHAAIDGEKALVAVRRVDTPDGSLVQGLAVMDSAAESWLAERAGHRDVALVHDPPAARDDAVVAPLAVGPDVWSLVVGIGDAQAAAHRASTDAERAFVRRFTVSAAMAIFCGVLLVLLVARTERFANERARFAAAAAHELRTPLAGLQLYGEMLAEGLGDPGKERDYAARVSEEASRLGRVVANVLGFSQLERGTLRLGAHPRDLGELARAAAERARPALERAGAVVELEIEGELPARVDDEAVGRILANLLDNAEKYGRGSDRRIRVTGAVRADMVEIAVADDGPGVAAAMRSRLFRPFARGGESDAPAGLGLGLMLSRALARAMGGDLVHRATPGGGATFVLTLPRSLTDS